MFNSDKPFIEFCCASHENYFTEEFQSDDDEYPSDFDFKSSYNVSFMPEPYEDIQRELIHSRYHEEIGIQCDFKPNISLSHYSSMQAISTSSKDKILIPTINHFTMGHTARAFFPVVIIDPFKCSICNLSFKSSKALIGHNAKKHRSK